MLSFQSQFSLLHRVICALDVWGRISRIEFENRSVVHRLGPVESFLTIYHNRIIVHMLVF